MRRLITIKYLLHHNIADAINPSLLHHDSFSVHFLLSYKISDYVNICFSSHCVTLGIHVPRLAFSKQMTTFMNAFVMQHHTNISFYRKPFMM